MSASTDFTEYDLALVRRSFLQALKDSDGFAVRLYDRLFEVAPNMRQLFTNDPVIQREKFIATLAIIVNGDAGTIQLDELGHHHREYGIKAGHFEPFRDALLWALRETLGDDLDVETEAAWGWFYDAAALKIKAQSSA